MRTIVRHEPAPVRFATEVIGQVYLGQVPRSGSIHVEIDLRVLLEQLGVKALFSKGRKARALRGAIKVKAVNVKEVQA